MSPSVSTQLSSPLMVSGLSSDFLWLSSLTGDNILGNPLLEFQITTIKEGVKLSHALVTSHSLLGRQK